MSEAINAYPISGLREHAISIESSTSFWNEGAETKNRISGVLINIPNRRLISFVERGFESDPETYVKNWIAFRSAGLPVIPTLRRSSSGTLLLTDVTANGSEVYGKSRWGNIRTTYSALDKPLPLDHIFVELTAEESFHNIRDAAEKYSSLATEKDLILPGDDPFELLVHPSGKWALCMLDLYWGDVNEGFLKEEVVARINNECTVEFLTQLQEMHAILECSQDDPDHASELIDAANERYWDSYFNR